MNCTETRDLLDEYVDGGLAAEAARDVDAHLDACAACREEARGLRALVSEARALPASIEPERDLWPAIAPRLGRVRTVRSFGRLFGAGRAWAPALAAAALIVAAGLTAVRVLLPGGPQGARPGEPASAIPAPEVVPAEAGAGDLAPSGRMRLAEEAFLEARRQLQTALDERRSMLSSETVKTVDDNLKIVEQAVLQIQAALVKDPGNRELERMLVAARQREVALLTQVTRTAALR